MRSRRFALMPTVVVLVALNVMVAHERERTVTTTTNVESMNAAVGTDDLIRHGGNLFSAKGCVSCHVQLQVGPSLANLKDRAAKTVQGLSADEYVRQSILAPSAFKAPGAHDGASAAMPTLPVNTAELDALVAYVLTL